MTPPQRARHMVKEYSMFVNGYVGSSMLTNDEYPEVILSNAKELATRVVDEIVNELNRKLASTFNDIVRLSYWETVKREIDNVKQEEIEQLRGTNLIKPDEQDKRTS